MLATLLLQTLRARCEGERSRLARGDCLASGRRGKTMVVSAAYGRERRFSRSCPDAGANTCERGSMPIRSIAPMQEEDTRRRRYPALETHALGTPARGTPDTRDIEFSGAVNTSWDSQYRTDPYRKLVAESLLRRATTASRFLGPAGCYEL